MLKRYWLLGLFVTGMFAFQAQNLFACVCFIDQRTVAQKAASYVKNADAVFSGEVVSIQYRKMSNEEIAEKSNSTHLANFFKGRSGIEILIIKIIVDRWWKGFEINEITLLTETFRASDGYSSTTSCERTFKTGEKVLLFAQGKDENHLQNKSCSGTGLLTDRVELIKALGNGRAPKQSTTINK